jgi:hypothetical protein
VTEIDPDDVARLRAVIGRLSRLLNASVADVGLTPTQLSVLGSVVRRGPIGVGELRGRPDHPGDRSRRRSRRPAADDDRGS